MEVVVPAMLLEDVTNRGATPALVKALAFNEARLRMIAENIANVHTPGYRTKQLDTNAFQRALREALDARGGDPHKPFVLKSPGEVETGRDGLLRVSPTEVPVENVLFHDGTNQSIERQMADLAETGMMHELTTALLSGYFDGARKAIRGTV